MRISGTVQILSLHKDNTGSGKALACSVAPLQYESSKLWVL